MNGVPVTVTATEEDLTVFDSRAHGEHQDDSLTAVVDLLEGSCMTSWIARKYCIRPRFEVHLQMVARTSLVDWHETVDVDIVPSTNGWCD
jgi:hypothetical protein